MRRTSAYLVENYEPMAWAEELIEPARAVDHPRLAFLYAMASQCWNAGRIEAAVGYADAAQTVIASGRHDEVPYGARGPAWRCVPGHRPARTVGRVVPRPARTWPRHPRQSSGHDLVFALTMAGSGEEARAAATGLIEAAEATHNPHVLALALYVHGFAFRDADPAGALEALRRGLVIAQDSGNRYIESLLADGLSHLEAEHGDPLAALDHVMLAIGNFHDAGNTTGGARRPRDPRRVVRPARTPRTGGHHRRVRRRQSPHRNGLTRVQHRDRPPARCARRGDLRIARPQG